MEKDIARGRQLCFFDDISELVQGNLNIRLIEAYSQFIKIIDDDDQEEITADTKCWFPIDFLISYKFHSYKKYDMNDEKNAWKYFFENYDPVGALTIAIDALTSRNLMKEYIYPFIINRKEGT